MYGLKISSHQLQIIMHPSMKKVPSEVDVKLDENKIVDEFGPVIVSANYERGGSGSRKFF